MAKKIIIDGIDKTNQGVGIGEPVFDGTSGSIPFIDSNNNLAEDNSNLFWDNVNKRLGIGTNSPNNKIQVADLINFDNALSNTLLGSNAGTVITSGVNNAAVGRDSLLVLTTGSNNMGFGKSSISKTTSGNNNVGVGFNSLLNNVTHSRCTAIGGESLKNSIGNNNTAVGYNALLNTTSGNDNVGIGTSVGGTNTVGTDLVLIGRSSDVSLNNLTNAIAIGSGAIVSASNSMVLGNGVNVGIGTSTPSEKLEVSGSLVLADNLIHQGDTNTVLQLSSDQFNFVTGASTRCTINNSGVRLNSGGFILNNIASLSDGIKLYSTADEVTDYGFGKLWMDDEREIYNQNIFRISVGSGGIFNSGDGWIVLGGDGASWNDACGRIDLNAGQIFLNGEVHPQGTLIMSRTSDATSVATQKKSYPLAFQTSLWSGSEYREYSSILVEPSTSDSGKYRIAFKTDTTASGIGGTESFSIDSDGIIKIGDQATNYTEVSATGDITQTGTARIQWGKITANSVTATGFTAVGQVVGDLQTANDGNVYTATEVAGGGNNIIVDFTNVTAFNWVKILGAYEGSSSHGIYVEVYNWSTISWNQFNCFQSQFTDTGALFCNHDYIVPSDTNYVGTGGDAGKVRVRFNHSSSTTSAHKLYIDVCALYQ